MVGRASQTGGMSVPSTPTRPATGISATTAKSDCAREHLVAGKELPELKTLRELVCACHLCRDRAKAFRRHVLKKKDRGKERSELVHTTNCTLCTCVSCDAARYIRSCRRHSVRAKQKYWNKKALRESKVIVPSDVSSLLNLSNGQEVAEEDGEASHPRNRHKRAKRH